MRDLSNNGAGINILKSLVGLGVLNLPFATKQVGCLTSVLGMGLMAAMTVYGAFFAVASKAKLDARHLSGVCPTEATPLKPCGPSSNYGLGCFDTVVREVLGWPGLALWVSSVVCYQGGIGVAYITLISQSMQNMTGMSHIHSLGFLCAVLTMMSSVRRMAGVALLSLAGLLVYLFVFLALARESAHRLADGKLGATASMWSTAGSEGLGSWFGIVSFAYCGLPICLSVYEDMKRPQDSMKVISFSFAVAWAIFAAFGGLGYLCYGQDTAEVIYMNFPEGSITRRWSEVALGVILMLTYVLQMMPVWNCVEACMGDSLHWLAQRAATVALTVLIAMLVPNTLLLVSVTGAVAAAISGFVLPPLVYLNLDPRPSPIEYIASSMLLVLGILGAAKGIA